MTDSFLNKLNSFIDKKLGPSYDATESAYYELEDADGYDRYTYLEKMNDAAKPFNIANVTNNPFESSEYNNRKDEEEVTRLYKKYKKHVDDMEALFDKVDELLPVRTVTFKIMVHSKGTVKQIIKWYEKQFEIIEDVLYPGMQMSISHIANNQYEITYKTKELVSDDSMIQESLADPDDDGNYPLKGKTVYADIIDDE